MDFPTCAFLVPVYSSVIVQLSVWSHFKLPVERVAWMSFGIKMSLALATEDRVVQAHTLRKDAAGSCDW